MDRCCQRLPDHSLREGLSYTQDAVSFVEAAVLWEFSFVQHLA